LDGPDGINRLQNGCCLRIFDCGPERIGHQFQRCSGYQRIVLTLRYLCNADNYRDSFAHLLDPLWAGLEGNSSKHTESAA
jgi:hypothetical protein